MAPPGTPLHPESPPPREYMTKKQTPHPCLSHFEEKGIQAVGAELNVLIYQGSDGDFIAQGIEIDYVASGSTEAEVRDRFADGFCQTILSYLRRDRPLNGLFKSQAPAEILQAYFAGQERDILRCEVGFKKQIPVTAPVPRTLAFHRPQGLELATA